MQNKPLKYLSICSGIEAATVAWHGLGWQPVGFSDIDAFPRALLAHHYPHVKLHGDFTAIEGSEHGAIDLLVGGTPCQSFSVAGLRKGLADDRGNLALEFIRLAERTRARWVVWENVPGVLSIDGGQAFGSFLGGLAECGYGFAYRILDAQYFGVPQRRRRVFVVGYLGDWRPAAAVLFERESLCGDITPRREARKGTAGAFETGPGGGRFTDLSATLDAHCKDGPMRNQAGMGVCHTLRGDGFDASEDGTGRGTPLVAGTVSSKWAKGTGGPAGDECQNLIADSVAYNVTFCDANGRRKDRPDGGLYVNEAETAKTLTSGGDLSTYIAFSAKDYGADAGENAPTLRAMNHSESHANGGGQIAVAIPLQEVGKRTGVSTNDTSVGSGIGNEGDAMFTLQASARHGVAYDTRSGLAPHGSMQGDTVCPTLRAKEHEPPMVLHDVAAFKPGNGSKARGIGYEEETAPTLEAGGGGNSQSAVLQRMAVRRLTPRECERLQGFPDDYTLVPFRGKPATDSARYKALGNSMAVPVMRWLGERIAMVEEQITR
jgi:DNA (cytosine-5)-methyltransferase 1